VFGFLPFYLLKSSCPAGCLRGRISQGEPFAQAEAAGKGLKQAKRESPAGAPERPPILEDWDFTVEHCQ